MLVHMLDYDGLYTSVVSVGLRMTRMAFLWDLAVCALIHSLFFFSLCCGIEMIRLENCMILTYQYMMYYRKSKTSTKPAWITSMRDYLKETTYMRMQPFWTGSTRSCTSSRERVKECMKDHEVLQMEKTPRTQHSQEIQILCNDIFKHLVDQAVKWKTK